MARTDLLSLLAGNIGSEDEYIARDPFYAGAVRFNQTPIQPRTSAEAIWAPALQGLISGTMTGLAKRGGRESMYQDVRQLLGSERPDTYGPLTQAESLMDYSSPTAPQGWTGKIGQQAILSNLIAGQNLSSINKDVNKFLLKTAFESDSLDDRDIAKAELQKRLGFNLGAVASNGVGGLDTEVKTITPITGLGDRRRQLQRETGSMKVGDALFKEEQKVSKKEEAMLSEVKTTLKEVGAVYDEVSSITQTGGALPGVSLLTETGAKIGGTQAVIMGFLQKFAKGNPSDKENAVLQQAMPKWYDSPERVLIKKKKMLTFLELSASGTPYLEGMAKAGMDVPLSMITAEGVLKKFEPQNQSRSSEGKTPLGNTEMLNNRDAQKAYLQELVNQGLPEDEMRRLYNARFGGG
jgi:hypothetical protein